MTSERGPELKVETFFRHQQGRVVASLTRLLGPKHLALAEESVQEACLRALRSWAMRGVPDDPAAWIFLAARNHALDVLRKQARHRGAGAGLESEVTRTLSAVESPPAAQQDDVLRLIFTCCHPELPRSGRVALTLRVVGGFTTEEIAHSFLLAETAVAQRLVRVKRRIATRGLPYRVPTGAELPGRLDAVLDVIYLIFNEGYAPHGGEAPLRIELMEEALRLGEMLTRSAATETPVAHALLALLWLQSSRTPARVDAAGGLVPLLSQDRSLWDRARIARGLSHLSRAAAGAVVSEFHLQAGIAAAHAIADSPDQTDWGAIVELYDQLLALNGSPVVRLNRAMAISMRDGAEVGLALLDQLERGRTGRVSTGPEPTGGGRLARYHLLAAARADNLARLGRTEEAAAEYARAADLARNGAERRFLRSRASSLRSVG
ncbi:MAG: sigma-70 family RNA polymerase sigma factor [Candidatus Eisenbacteria bacterium]|nr:sigma-70 family RNA polymerase sigma factor [Candidatus Eisenbacteria bacterium]